MIFQLKVDNSNVNMPRYTTQSNLGLLAAMTTHWKQHTLYKKTEARPIFNTSTVQWSGQQAY